MIPDTPARAATSTTPVTGHPARFSDLLAAEWIKARSLRSTSWTITLTVLFVIGSAAVAALTDDQAGSVRPAGFRPFDAYPPAGYWTLMLIAGSTGALSVVSEYSSGLIHTTTVAVPARGCVVLAKATVTAALWTVAGTVISVGTFLVSQAVLDERHAGVAITHPGVARAMAASALLAPVCALIGLGLGVLIRHSATTMVTGAFALLMLPQLFSDTRPWAAHVNHATVLTAWRRLVQNWPPDPTSRMLSATVHGSWLVYALWPLIAIALAVFVVRRRDV